MTAEQFQAYRDKRARECAKRDEPPVLVYSPEPATAPVKKFRNVQSGRYASKREARAATELETLERSGQIRDLKEQVRFLLIPAQLDAQGKTIERPCYYTADFTFDEWDAGRKQWTKVVADAKGYPNDRWPLKRKLMLFVHGVRVREI